MLSDKKLYLVKLKGLHGTGGGSIDFGNTYVIAPDETSAYMTVKYFVEKEGLGFTNERVLDSIKLIADAYRYTQCGTLLMFSEQSELNIKEAA